MIAVGHFAHRAAIDSDRMVGSAEGLAWNGKDVPQLRAAAALLDKRGKRVRRHNLEQVVDARGSPRCTAYGPMGVLALSFQITDAIGSVSPSAFSNDRGNQRPSVGRLGRTRM
jgi:hypothetical protein